MKNTKFKMTEKQKRSLLQEDLRWALWQKPENNRYMTNLQKWRSRTDGLPTPDRMVDWAYYSLIGACLQRRVWLPPAHEPLYPSNYIVFVSPPAIGKSLIIKVTENFSKYWKHGDNQALLEEKFTDSQHKTIVEAITDTDAKRATENTKDDAEIVKPYLIPIAADASTYEALVLAFGKCYRRINYKEYNTKAEKEIIQVYGHASLYFQLKELASLLRKRTNDTVTFLLGLYDCPIDYEYDTVTREKDRIRKGCLNILAATNPKAMNEMFDDGLIDTAFFSRIIFVYASKNRKIVDEIPELTEEQKQYEIDLKNHILKLTTLYGQITITDEARKWIKEWYFKHEENPKLRSSQNPKLVPYYGRKLIHMKKTAMDIHFGESTDMTMGVEPFQKAVELLDKEEKFMHLALTLDAKDKGAQISKKMLEILSNSPRNKVELFMDIFEQLGLQDSKANQEALDFLYETNQIKFEVRKDETTGNDVNYWRIV